MSEIHAAFKTKEELAAIQLPACNDCPPCLEGSPF